MRVLARAVVLATLTATSACAAITSGPGWFYSRIGNANDVQTKPSPGFMFEGGGRDVNEAFKWFCAKANGGDFLVLRASGTSAYDPYIQRLCPGLNSVATLRIVNLKGATEPFVYNAITHAEALFIAGGDQGNYVNYWQGTPVMNAINAAAARGVPVGGTSAGNAILAQYAFSAVRNTITSKEALANCFDRRITIDNGFLDLTPLLFNTITDDHFVARNRMGRLVTFMARILLEGTTSVASGIAVNEHTAFLMEADGSGIVRGDSTVYFLRSSNPPATCVPETPLTFTDVPVQRIARYGTFNVGTWTGTRVTSYTVSAVNGVMTSTQPGGSLY